MCHRKKHDADMIVIEHSLVMRPCAMWHRYCFAPLRLQLVEQPILKTYWGWKSVKHEDQFNDHWIASSETKVKIQVCLAWSPLYIMEFFSVDLPARPCNVALSLLLSSFTAASSQVILTFDMLRMIFWTADCRSCRQPGNTVNTCRT